jgi:hypothetical protein
VIEAFRSAGATEEMIADAHQILDACIKLGRPRIHENRAACQRAYRARRKEREKTRGPSLKGLLVDAAGWNVDREADVAPILALIDQGCDLKADVLPTVARTVPELPRPLRSWAAKWLVQEILATRERRLTDQEI